MNAVEIEEAISNLALQDALAEFLPLDEQNWIVWGNALRLDWLASARPRDWA